MGDIQKRSIGVSIFGWCDIVVGSVGGIFFIGSSDMVLRSFYYLETKVRDVFTVGINFRLFDLGFLYSVMTFPYVIIFFSALGILGLRSWARKLKLLMVPIVIMDGYFFVHVNRVVLNRQINWSAFLTLFIPLLVWTALSAYFFSRRGIKQQFHFLALPCCDEAAYCGAAKNGTADETKP